MLNLAANVGLASTLIFATRTLPLDSTPNWSIIGAIAPQLGHHGAQAHIRTGSGDFSTIFSKLPSDIIIGCGVKSSSVFNFDPHLPHLAPAFSLPAGTLFLAPQSVQRILYLASGSAAAGSVGNSVWHLPHLAAIPNRSAGMRLAASQFPHRIIIALLSFIYHFLHEYRQSQVREYISSRLIGVKELICSHIIIAKAVL